MTKWTKEKLEKIVYQKCAICGFNRYIENCHIIPKRMGGGKGALNMITLCPNHHKLLDLGLLNNEETANIEGMLIALTELYKDKNDKRKLQYLYFQLRILNNPPQYLAKNKTRQILKRLPSNRYL